MRPPIGIRETSRNETNIFMIILYLSKCCCLSECAEIHTIEAIPAEIKTRLNEFLKCISALESVFILNTKGEVVITNIGNLPAGNYASHNYFVEAMNGVAFVSEPKMEQGKGYFYCSIAIRGSNKEIIGVLVMQYPAESLWSFVEEEKDISEKGGVCILSDRFGVSIGHATKRSLIFKSWLLYAFERKGMDCFICSAFFRLPCTGETSNTKRKLLNGNCLYCYYCCDMVSFNKITTTN